MHLPSRSLRQFWWFYPRGEESRRGMHTGSVSLSLYLKFPIYKLETKSLTKRVAYQGIKAASQAQKPGASPGSTCKPQIAGGAASAPAHGQARALNTAHQAFLLLRGRRDSGFAAHFTTDPSQAVLLLTVNYLQHAWCCAKGMAVERKLTSHSELIWFSSFTISLSWFFVFSVNQNSLKLHMKRK